MKIMTLGKSPYLLTSHACANALFLKHLHQSGHSVASIVSNHDTSYYHPEEGKDGTHRFYYKYGEHKIPIVPFNHVKDPAIQVYEILNVYKPEILITIGDFNDFIYMKAVKMFVSDSFKWISVLMNHSYPLNEKNIELIDDMDGILCTNKQTYQMVEKKFKKSELELSFVGSQTPQSTPNRKELRKTRNIDGFRIMTAGKNAQVDNVPMLMEAVSELRQDIPNLELYVHSNVYDTGDYDMNLVQSRFDPKEEFIRFPVKYVSLVDGYTDEEFQHELQASDLFISISMNASSGWSVFEAIANGCLPLMTDTGCHRDIAGLISNFCPEIERNDILIPCIDLMGVGETYLNICLPGELKKKICLLQQKITKKEGWKSGLTELIEVYSQKEFLNKFDKMIIDVHQAISSICVESIGD